MGNYISIYLKNPHTEVEVEEGYDDSLNFCVGSMQVFDISILPMVILMKGWRKTMEDSHLACLDVNQYAEVTGFKPRISLFGVFDGHGGIMIF